MAIAMQGIGFGQHLAAVQGLWCVLDYIPPKEECSLLPLAIALQGIGYGMHLSAVQGLWYVCRHVIPVEELGGGGGYAKRDAAADRFLQQIRDEDELIVLLMGAVYESGVFG